MVLLEKSFELPDDRIPRFDLGISFSLLGEKQLFQLLCFLSLRLDNGARDSLWKDLGAAVDGLLVACKDALHLIVASPKQGHLPKCVLGHHARI